MDLQELKNNIKNKELSNFYIFSGNEFGIMKEYVQKIAQIKNQQIRIIDSLIEVKNEIAHKSLLNRKHLYYVINDKNFYNDKQLLKLLEKNTIEDTIIIRIEKIDNRIAALKKFNECIIYFNTLSIDILCYYVKKYFNIEEELCKYLVECCEYDYNRLMSELDKLNCLKAELSKKHRITDNVLIRHALTNNLISLPYSSLIFDLCDYIMSKNIDNMFIYSDLCINNGEEPLVIIKILFNRVKNLLMYKGYDCKVPGKLINYYELENCKKIYKLWTAKQLVHFLKMLQEVEIMIKSGQLDSALSINYLIINIFGGINEF